MHIKLGKGNKAMSLFALLVGSIVLAVIAASMGNQFWSSPLIGLALMFLLGSLPSQNPADKFEWAYCVLIIGSGALLVLTSEQIYWSTPLLLGVLYNLFVGELIITSE